MTRPKKKGLSIDAVNDSPSKSEKVKQVPLLADFMVTEFSIGILILPNNQNQQRKPATTEV